MRARLGIKKVPTRGNVFFNFGGTALIRSYLCGAREREREPIILNGW